VSHAHIPASRHIALDFVLIDYTNTHIALNILIELLTLEFPLVANAYGNEAILGTCEASRFCSNSNRPFRFYSIRQ